MKLDLVQHGDAKPKEEDPDRPLSGKGRADVQKMGSFLAVAGLIPPKSIFHSGKTRARETAEILAASLNPAGGAARADGLDPLAEFTAWAEKCAIWEEDLMLVGHLPHLCALASALLCGDEAKRVVSFSPGSVLCLERDDAGSWSIRWMLAPEMMR